MRHAWRHKLQRFRLEWLFCLFLFCGRGLTNSSIDINTSGLPARNIFAWILRYQFKITKADEYWRKMTNMRVIEHRWLLNNTKYTGQQSTSPANTLIFRASLITLFKAELAVQMYIYQWTLPMQVTSLKWESNARSRMWKAFALTSPN